jgi:hypothetical protein
LSSETCSSPASRAQATGPTRPVKAMAAINCWFQTGQHVADPTRQREVFGHVPTAEDAIANLVRSQGHAIAA